MALSRKVHSSDLCCSKLKFPVTLRIQPFFVTSEQASLFADEQIAPRFGVHSFLNPMYPHTADNLLLPGSVIYQFAFAEYLTRNYSGFRVPVNNAMPHHAAVLSIDGEVVAFLKVPKALIVPIAILVSKAILEDKQEFAMFDDLQAYPWVLPAYRYQTPDTLLANLNERVIAPAEEKVKELRRKS